VVVAVEAAAAVLAHPAGFLVEHPEGAAEHRLPLRPARHQRQRRLPRRQARRRRAVADLAAAA
jgi:hypothetical protein